MKRPYRRGDTALTEQLVVKIHPNVRAQLEAHLDRRRGDTLSDLVRRILTRYLNRK